MRNETIYPMGKFRIFVTFLDQTTMIFGSLGCDPGLSGRSRSHLAELPDQYRKCRT